MKKREPLAPETTPASVEHVLAPKIVKISQKEIKELLDSGASKENLPRIKLLDPGLRGLDVEIGSIVKVLRESAITGKEEPYYRVVVA